MNRLLSLLAPPSCVACRSPVRAGGPVLCGSCAASLPWLRGTRCLRCGLPRHHSGGCPAAVAAFARAWAPLVYEGVARDVVRALKFDGRLPVAELMAAHLAANLPGDLRREPASVVPVPAHRGRLRRRGYDPAGALATAFARRTERDIETCLRRLDRLPPLERIRGRSRRTGELRIECVRAPPPLVLLVDDVHTTGATARAAAAALAGAGTEWIAVVSYARTL